MSSIIFFLIFIPILSIILLSVNFIFAPHNPYKEKKTPFECGYHSFLSQNRTQFTISFFIFALLFLIFDLEIVLIYPFTVSSYANNIYGLVVMIIFTLIVTVGFIFELGKNALKIESKQNKIINFKNKKLTSSLTKLESTLFNFNNFYGLLKKIFIFIFYLFLFLLAVCILLYLTEVDLNESLNNLNVNYLNFRLEVDLRVFNVNLMTSGGEMGIEVNKGKSNLLFMEGAKDIIGIETEQIELSGSEPPKVQGEVSDVQKELVKLEQQVKKELLALYELNNKHVNFAAKNNIQIIPGSETPQGVLGHDAPEKHHGKIQMDIFKSQVQTEKALNAWAKAECFARDNGLSTEKTQLLLKLINKCNHNFPFFDSNEMQQYTAESLESKGARKIVNPFEQSTEPLSKRRAELPIDDESLIVKAIKDDLSLEEASLPSEKGEPNSSLDNSKKIVETIKQELPIREVFKKKE